MSLDCFRHKESETCNHKPNFDVIESNMWHDTHRHSNPYETVLNRRISVIDLEEEEAFPLNP